MSDVPPATQISATTGNIALGRPAARTIVTTRNPLTRLIALLCRIPWMHRFINDQLIHLVVSSTKGRPLPDTLWGPSEPAPGDPMSAPSARYVAWPALVDRRFTGLHLPPRDADAAPLPPVQDLKKLFERGPTMTPCPRSSALFCFFAQWFTDSFLRTDPDDFRRNTSNHEIDLCQIYGLCEADTHLLRSHQDGKLKCIGDGHSSYPARLFKADGRVVADEFRGLTYIDRQTGQFRNPILTEFDTPDRRRQLHATGLERGNSTIFYSALNTLFLREHNRLCERFRKEEGLTDDDEIFAYARNTNIAQLLKIIIEDYINHLSAAPVNFILDVGKGERRPWYRSNRISAEFNLLYRWHSLTPSAISIGGVVLAHRDFRFNNHLLETSGLEAILEPAALQSAGKIGLKNTPDFLVEADLAAVRKSRRWELRGYNAYREAFGLPKLANTQALTKDNALAAELDALYGNIDAIELGVGLLAEARAGSAPLGELMRLMVGADAFSQALTNPLLSRNIFGPRAFTPTGLESIRRTRRFDDIAQRNMSPTPHPLSFSL